MPSMNWEPDFFFDRLPADVVEIWLTWAQRAFSLDGAGPVREQIARAWGALPWEHRKFIEATSEALKEMFSPRAREFAEVAALEIWPDDPTWRGLSQQVLVTRLLVTSPVRFHDAHNDYRRMTMPYAARFQGAYPLDTTENFKGIQRLQDEVNRVLAQRGPGAENYSVASMMSGQSFSLFVYGAAENSSWRRAEPFATLTYSCIQQTLDITAWSADDGEMMRDLFAISIAGDPRYFEAPTMAVRDSDIVALHRRPASHAQELLKALAVRNGLFALETEVPDPFLPVGIICRRGLTVPVVWTREIPKAFGLLCRGIRTELGYGRLIVMMSRDPGFSFKRDEKIALRVLKDDPEGHFGLAHALDELDPGYRERAVLQKHPQLDLDWLRLRFDSQDGRHLVTVAGCELQAFAKGDVVFSQLLLLATSRTHGMHGGWRHKAALIGDFSLNPDPRAMGRGERALEGLRAAVKSCRVPGVSSEELASLVKAERGSGQVRIAVPSENISFGPSLRAIRWRQGATASPSMREGLARARLLIDEATRMGAPVGFAEALKILGNRLPLQGAPDGEAAEDGDRIAWLPPAPGHRSQEE